MNLLMSSLFCATLLLLVRVSLFSSVTKIMELLRERTIFQVYCLFIFTSMLITFATFVVENLNMVWNLFGHFSLSFYSFIFASI